MKTQADSATAICTPRVSSYHGQHARQDNGPSVVCCQTSSCRHSCRWHWCLSVTGCRPRRPMTALGYRPIPTYCSPTTWCHS